MEQLNLDWMSNDKALMDTLAGIASINDESSAANSANAQADNILDFLLQSPETATTSNNIVSANGARTATTISQPHQLPQLQLSQDVSYPTPPSSQNVQINVNNTIVSNQNTPINTTSSQSQPVSFVQDNNNFVTVIPAQNNSSVKTRKPAVKRRTKFQEPIFVTESPESFRNRKKTGNSSGDDISEDEITPSEANMSASALKNMTPKEKRQLRNKISARNFRVRRKEYMSQLEERVDEQKRIIANLKKENEELRKVNAELMKQLVIKPASPPSLSSDEAISSSSTTSGSEGHQSPASNSPSYPFPLPNLYDFSLINQQQPSMQAPTQSTPQISISPEMTNPDNLFFFHEAAMPDWDLPRILGDKANISERDHHEREIAQRLMRDYPLLAPALMSMVLHHTISMEYVAELAKEFSNGLEAELKSDDDQDTLLGEDIEDLKAQLDSLHIESTEEVSATRAQSRRSSLLKEQTTKKAIKNEPETTTESSAKKDELTEADLVRKMLTKHFQFYVFLRARGLSHDEIMDRNRDCLRGDKTHCKNPLALSKLKKMAGSKQEDKKNNCLQTMHSFSRVAGELLRNPKRMTHVREVLLKEVRCRPPDTKQATPDTKYEKSISSPSRPLRIAQ